MLIPLSRAPEVQLSPASDVRNTGVEMHTASNRQYKGTPGGMQLPSRYTICGISYTVTKGVLHAHVYNYMQLFTHARLSHCKYNYPNFLI